MAEETGRRRFDFSGWRARLELTSVVAISALALSGLSFYRSYIYTKQQLDVTVTEVSYATNQGELYMTIAFSNAGNRDGVLLRAEPALWGKRDKPEAEWLALDKRVHPDIPVTAPKTPTVVHAGGVEMVTLSAKLDAEVAEHAVTSKGSAFVGIRVATMNSDGNLYLLEHPVAESLIDKQGNIRGAKPAIHQSLSGFADVEGAPPGDMLQSNKKTPFVWAAEHS